MSQNNMSSQQISIQSAAQDGLSEETVGLLVNNLSAATMAGAAGTSVDDLAGDEVTLFVRVIDRTGSIEDRGLAQPMRDAANEQIEALEGSKAADSVLMSTLLFHTATEVLHSYLSLGKAIRLDASNYRPTGGTALFDATLDAVTSAVDYAQQLRDAGVRVKVVVVIMTDGEDNSSRHSAGQVASVIKDLIAQEIYTFAFVAFGTQGRMIGQMMGIPSANIIDQQATAHDIRIAFDTVSRSVIRASQTIVGAQSASFFN